MTTTPGPRTEPRTEAGRAMLYDWQKRRTHPPTEARQESYRQFILAIEAEARADVDGLVARVEALRDQGPEDWPATAAWDDALDAVLALLAGDKAEAPRDPRREVAQLGPAVRAASRRGDADYLFPPKAGDKAEAPNE